MGTSFCLAPRWWLQGRRTDEHRRGRGCQTSHYSSEPLQGRGFGLAHHFDCSATIAMHNAAAEIPNASAEMMTAASCHLRDLCRGSWSACHRRCAAQSFRACSRPARPTSPCAFAFGSSKLGVKAAADQGHRRTESVPERRRCHCPPCMRSPAVLVPDRRLCRLPS